MLHRFLRDTKFGLNEFQGTGDDQQPSIDEREILEDERRRLERAIQRLKTLYLYSEDSMSEKQFIEENNALIADLNRVSSRLDELNETEGSFDGEYIPDSMFERASYVLISEELLSNRYVDYEELKQAVDRRVLKKFINMSLTNICVKNGKIESLTLKNGIEIRFTYQEL